MAFYKYPHVAPKADDALFDQLQSIGSTAPRAAVQCCPVCSAGAAGAPGQGSPAHGHHAHPTGTASAHWQLLVPART